MQTGVGLLVSDVMPIYMIIPRYSHNYAQFCQLLNSNLFTHRRILMLLREATSETYGPRVYSHHINLHHFIIALIFTFHFASLYQKYQKYYLSSLSDLTPVSDREGIVSGGICLHEHLWGRSPFSVRRGAELARRADRDDAHEGFTQLRATR